MCEVYEFLEIVLIFHLYKLIEYDLDCNHLFFYSNLIYAIHNDKFCLCKIHDLLFLFPFFICFAWSNGKGSDPPVISWAAEGLARFRPSSTA